ncbi:MAG: patatin-like phospholipase family protein [Mycobacteriales bacterium]|nr:patatin-like phospholipase family protein [Frankia sp.]
MSSASGVHPLAKPRGKRRGLVLGAGGVLGASWTIGALSALEDTTGWDARTADVIIGTSAGAVLAAFLGSNVATQSLLNHQRGIVAPGDPVIEPLELERDSGNGLPPMPRFRMGSPALWARSARHPRQVTPLAAVSSMMPQGRGSLEPVRRLVEAVTPAGEWASHPRTWIVAMDYDTGRRIPFGRAGSPPAGLSEAVTASCAIPGWYAPVTIGGRRYVDGGACSPTSLDLVVSLGLDEVFVLSPMTSFTFDRPTRAAARVERYLRRLVTRRLVREADKVRAAGTDVVMLGPGPEDLHAIGANLMDPRRRDAVLETSLRTSAVEIRRQLGAQAAAG